LVDVLSREEIEQLEGAALNERDNLVLCVSPQPRTSSGVVVKY
jgi:hypothetical protein